MNIGVIGLGYWGPNIVRNLVQLNQHVTLFDRDAARVKEIHTLYPACEESPSLENILNERSISAVALAIPLPHHCDLVLRLLDAGKHVFVEKPLCASLAEADAIRAHLNGSVLMVAHITQFSKGIERLTGCIRGNVVGEVRRLAFVRTHLGPAYLETDVLTEVAAHDVAIVASILAESPHSVNAWGVKRLNGPTFDAAHVVFLWDSGCIAQIDVQWASPIRRRTIEVEGTAGTLYLQSEGSAEDLTWYDHREAYEALSQRRRGAVAKELVQTEKLEIESTEPLREELAHFLCCIERGATPRTDFTFSRKVVGMLEAARSSMLSGGERVEISR